jgi:hypothetical protein
MPEPIWAKREASTIPFTCTVHELMLKEEECTSLPRQVGVREDDFAERPGTLAFGIGMGTGRCYESSHLHDKSTLKFFYILT